MALIDDFKAKFPNDFTTSEIDDNWVNLDPDYSYFYNADLTIARQKSAALYLIAHLLYIILEPGKGSIRTAQNQSVHDISISYAMPTNIDSMHEFYGTTKYGQRFMQIVMVNNGAIFA